MLEKTITIKVIGHKTSGLLVAYSDELHGLVIHGRTIEELKEKSPAAVREILEAMGETVAGVEVRANDGPHLENFVPPSFIAQACLNA